MPNSSGHALHQSSSTTNSPLRPADDQEPLRADLVLHAAHRVRLERPVVAVDDGRLVDLHVLPAAAHPVRVAAEDVVLPARRRHRDQLQRLDVQRRAPIGRWPALAQRGARRVVAEGDRVVERDGGAARRLAAGGGGGRLASADRTVGGAPVLRSRCRRRFGGGTGLMAGGRAADVVAGRRWVRAHQGDEALAAGAAPVAEALVGALCCAWQMGG